MNSFYTNERNAQMLIFLMKAHGVRKIVASPGTTNMCFVASVQQNPYFEIYSSVDERSAAYIACGLAAESGEPVALSCTGATASRNYASGLTEAFYRKLPILAITSTQHLGKIGHNMPQVIDRRTMMNDIAKLSVQIPTIHDLDDEWAYGVMLNNALLELTHRGGGPVHINLATTYSENYTVKEISPVKIIKRVNIYDELPIINKNSRVAIFVGSHMKWDDELTRLTDEFCKVFNGVVLCDHTSNYKGEYRVNPNILLSQDMYDLSLKQLDLMVHIGDVSGAYMSIKPKVVWRVNPDGEIRDTFKKMKFVFEMEEKNFFERYLELGSGIECDNTHIEEWRREIDKIKTKLTELPFSNIWIASKTASKLPRGSVLHLGILNSLRSWNFFDIHDSVLAYSNTGGFGIDGVLSSLVGASLVDRKKIYFGVLGDLAFFYDMNVLGNRHIGNNLRIMIVNNGKGTEFRNYNHKAAQFGGDADRFIAAAGHFGNQSYELIKNYAENLGFDYLQASSKEEFVEQMDLFVNSEMTEKPILFEVFTDSEDESETLKTMRNLEVSHKGVAKKIVKGIIGNKNVDYIKKVFK